LIKASSIYCLKQKLVQHKKIVCDKALQALPLGGGVMGEKKAHTWLQNGAMAQWVVARIPKRAPASAPASEKPGAAAAVVVAATAMVFPNSLKAGSILMTVPESFLEVSASAAVAADAAAAAPTTRSSTFIIH
jgi:hypothetical protein